MTPATTFADSIVRDPDWMTDWKAENPRTPDLSEQDWARVKQEMMDDGQQIVGLGGGAKPKRGVPAFDISNTAQSFNDGAAVPAPSPLGKPQRFVVADSSMRMVSNMEYVGPNGEANIVSATVRQSEGSDFFAYSKQTLQGWAEDGAIWRVRRGDAIGTVALHSSSALGAATDILYPGSELQAVTALAGGVVIGKAAPVAMGYLNSLPILGDSLPQLGGRMLEVIPNMGSRSGYSGLRYQVGAVDLSGESAASAISGANATRNFSTYTGDELAGNFVGPLSQNSYANRIVGNVTAPIDFDGHILAAEIKANGNVVGGHSIANGNVQVIPGTASAPNAQGVYSAKVQVADPGNPGQFLPKTNNGGVSTLFPDSWTVNRIKVEVDSAYQNRTIVGNKWTGTTPSGVRVEGFSNPKTTVYPKF